MGVTQLTTRQLGPNSVNSDDLDITTTTKAVVTKLVAGTNISLNSTGIDAGTGVVTINATAAPISLSEVATDPVFPANGDMWNYAPVPVVGQAMGMLGMTYNGANKLYHKLSVKTTEGIKRVQLT